MNNKYTSEQLQNILMLYNSVEEMEIISEIRALEEWFIAYDMRINQAKRYDDLGLSWIWKDDYHDKTYTSLEELNKQAQIVELKLKELREKNITKEKKHE